MAFGRGNRPPGPVAAPTGGTSPGLAGKAIRADRDALFADPSLHGRAFCRAYANRADAWLTTLLGAETDVALVAVGGYGRAELAPGSDLDVILLHRGRPRSDAEVRALAERIWYPLWDAGLKLGHGVRTVKEALALAATDLDTATSLLDVRLIAGDSGLSDDLARRAEVQWQSRSDRWLTVVGEAVADRHERAGEVAFLLEPDLKEGRGGLRDVHAQHWAEAARRILLQGDEASLAAAYDTLLDVRVPLHRRTGKASDRLLLQEQDGIAAD
ncbi:MAG TPA: [protein-PII] uridylyltransferase, partial [Acidimicrobiia bacterium]|nr:[protein-PII] uridylyltransferase [Acidimicrobiia bacterium]